MNPLDWLLTAILVYSTIRAAMRGFVRVALSLAGLILGLIVAGWGYRALAPHLSGLVSQPQLQLLLAFIALLAACIFIAHIVALILHRAVSAIGLSALNRMLGALLGLVRGAFIAVTLLTTVIAFLPASAWVAQSRLAPYLLRGVHAVSFVMPSELAHRLLYGAAVINHKTRD